MMKKALSAILASALLLPLAACAGEQATSTAQSTPQPTAETAADLVLKNGKIYTESEVAPWAEAVAVRNGEFVYVGSDAGLDAWIGENTQVIDLGGQMMTPNLIDAHTHPATVGMTDWHIRMYGPETLDEILAYVSDYLAAHSVEEAPVCYFEYYPSDLFGAEGPHKEVLDEIAPDRPVLVQDFSDHACWVNSRFLELLGVNDLPADDASLQHFMRDENGELTGWIKENAWKDFASNLYDAVGWYPPEDCTEDIMSILTDDLKNWGVTGVMDAYVEQELQVKSISDMDKAGKLNMYYDFAVVLDDYESLDDTLETIRYYNETYGTDHVTVDTVKIFYDGTNELGNSAVIEPTLDDPDNHGFMLMDFEQTKDTIRRCNEAGADVHFHLVGDLAFRTVCDAVEELIAEQGPLTSQVEMCHCELVNEADMTRPAELGILINWTPHWSGGYFGDASLQYLGQERYDSMYQFNPMIESGAIVTFGSDVYSMYEENRANPYFGMQTAMTRVDIEVPLDCDMRAREDAKLSLQDLLKGYTINAAIQLRIDDRTGSIEVGKKANFNLYTEDLFDVAPEEFQFVTPAAVVFEGNLLNGELPA